MKIDPRVAAAAKHFAGDSVEFGKLMQAVTLAEGGIDHIVKAVQCSIPSITSLDDALDVLARSETHALMDFLVQSGLVGTFIMFWARRWAPVGSANDPKHLNVNWPGNVKAYYAEAVEKT